MAILNHSDAAFPVALSPQPLLRHYWPPPAGRRRVPRQGTAGRLHRGLLRRHHDHLRAPPSPPGFSLCASSTLSPTRSPPVARRPRAHAPRATIGEPTSLAHFSATPVRMPRRGSRRRPQRQPFTEASPAATELEVVVTTGSAGAAPAGEAAVRRRRRRDVAGDVMRGHALHHRRREG
ncbi:hypothetical protein EE612_030555 [Oryza sativa]|nr:hypothetical protein EE612_030555 [Oryza sativa]